MHLRQTEIGLFIVFIAGCSVSKPVPNKTFYLAVQEIFWDYTPYVNQEKTLSKPTPKENNAQPPKKQVFKKAVYLEYTDGTFGTEKPKPKWQGFIGPTLFTEAGDYFNVVLFNNASRPFSFHPHGVLYTKTFEGALYVDGLHYNKSANMNDIVQPGETFTYEFHVDKESSPRKEDPDCLTWLYHSHVVTVNDVNTGLVGMLLTCKKGILNKNRGRHYSLYVGTIEEDKSWFKNENKKRASLNGTIFGRMPMINGFMYGNIPNLESCVGETVTWHFAGLGTKKDNHALSISGHSFEYFHRRESNINVDPTRFWTATTTSHKEGKWLISCKVDLFTKAGLYGYLHVKKCPNRLQPLHQNIRKVRWHYIAAEEVLWNYGPTRKNLLTGESLFKHGSITAMFFKKSNTSIGGTYKKAVFRAYDDYHFKTKKIQDGRPEHLGILGPIIRAEVGDLIQVVFKNKASRPYSLHTEGAMFSKRSEGMSYGDGDGSQYVKDNAVAPGETYTYFWYISEDMGPTESDPQCLTRRYISAVDPVRDPYSGLFGPLLVCKPGTLDKRGKQKYIDKEFILMMMIIDENLSWYLDENIARAGVDKSVKKKEFFMNANLRNSINGLMYGNLLGLDMCIDDTVAWHLSADGSIYDVHGVYFHGHFFTENNERRNTVGLLPAERKTLYMKPDLPGKWKVQCGTFEHPENGELTTYSVKKCSVSRKSPRGNNTAVSQTRTFYIQADITQWDYVPLGRDILFDKKLPPKYEFGKFTKVLYHGYTDDTFTTRLNRTGQEYLGIQGPLIKVEVGDTLEVVFRNKGPRPFSFHPQRLVSRTETLRQDQPAVAPGKTFTYRWRIREAEGPGKKDPSCVTSPYYSDVNTIKDVYTGLLGTLVICRPGTLDKNGKRKDVDRDFAIFFNIMQEFQSWFIEENTLRCRTEITDYAFCATPIVYAINGYTFGNQPPPTMKQYETVDWYILTIGNNFNVHPAHFHGNNIFVTEGSPHFSDVTELISGTYNVLRMRANNPGNWLFHCHLNSHIEKGMESMYIVEQFEDNTQ